MCSLVIGSRGAELPDALTAGSATADRVDCHPGLVPGSAVQHDDQRIGLRHGGSRNTSGLTTGFVGSAASIDIGIVGGVGYVAENKDYRSAALYDTIL